MKLKVGQRWISITNPHEDFEIYDGVEDSIVLSDLEKEYDLNDFENLPESAKVFFWRRINDEAFDDFVKSKKGDNYESTYPYTWCGESKKTVLVSKIKKYNMKLKESL